MAKFRITGPDGATYEISAPDGASQADVMAFAQRNFSAPNAQTQQPAYNPTDDMSTIDRVRAGIGKGMVDTVRGAKQLALDAGAAIVPDALGGKKLEQWSDETQADIDEAKRLDSALMNTTSGAIGNVAGRIATALPTVFIPGANTMTGAAAVGALQGLMDPVATGDSRLQNTLVGGVAGGGGVALGRTLKSGYQGAKGLVEPFTAAGRDRITGRVLREFAADPTAAAAAARVAPARTATGAVPMLDEATKDVGLAQLRRAMMSADTGMASDVASREMANNAARLGVLQDLAGDAGKRSAVEAARKGATADLYSQATQAAYTVDDELASLLNTPAVRQAMARAETLAANNRRPFSLYAPVDRPQYVPPTPYPVTLKGIQAEERRRLAMESAPGAFAGVGGIKDDPVRKLTGQGLQDLKMAMDEMLSDPASGFTGKAGATVKNLRGQILDWMERANPEFKTARTTYAAMSKPLNQMDIGDRLLKTATSATTDLQGNPRVMANSLARQLRDEGSLVKQSGLRGVQSLEDILEPQQLSAIRSVLDEMNTRAALQEAGKVSGSPTAQYLAGQNALRRIIGPTGMPNSWAEGLMSGAVGDAVSSGLGGVYKVTGAAPRLQTRIAEAMLEPQQAARLMDAAVPAAAPKSTIARRLLETAAKRAPSSIMLANQ